MYVVYQWYFVEKGKKVEAVLQAICIISAGVVAFVASILSEGIMRLLNFRLQYRDKYLSSLRRPMQLRALYMQKCLDQDCLFRILHYWTWTCVTICLET